MTATPGSSVISSVSGNDLKPRMRSERRCTEAAFSRSPRTARRLLEAERSRCARARRRAPRAPARAASCSAAFFVEPLPDAELLAGDVRRADEPPVVRRALDLEHGVVNLRPRARERLLELGLVVDVARARVLDALAERLDDRGLDRARSRARGRRPRSRPRARRRGRSGCARSAGARPCGASPA